MDSTTNNQLEKLSTTELEKFLQQRKSEEKQQSEKKRQAYLKNKEKFLTEVNDFFSITRSTLQEFKKRALETADQLNKNKYEIEGKQAREAKSFELKNDSIKIVVETQERFDFTDDAIVHITAIKDIFQNKFEGRNKGFYSLLDGLLLRNSKGEYDPKLLIKIRKQARELEDETLIAEVDKLYDCQVVTGTAKYLRVYQKDKTNRWKDISLNFSSL